MKKFYRGSKFSRCYPAVIILQLIKSERIINEIRSAFFTEVIIITREEEKNNSYFESVFTVLSYSIGFSYLTDSTRDGTGKILGPSIKNLRERPGSNLKLSEITDHLCIIFVKVYIPEYVVA